MKVFLLLCPLVLFFSSSLYAQRIIDSQDLLKEYHVKLKKNPKDKEVLLKLGSLYSQKNNHERALEYLERAKKLSQNDVRIIFEIGYVYQRLDKTKRSEKIYKRVLKIDPQHEEALFNLGVIKTKTDKTAAKKYFGRILKLNPKNVSAHFAMAESYKSTGKCDKALKHLNQVIQSNPKAVLAYMRIAQCQKQIGSLETALKSYKEMILVAETEDERKWLSQIEKAKANALSIHKAISRQKRAQ